MTTHYQKTLLERCQNILEAIEYAELRLNHHKDILKMDLPFNRRFNLDRVEVNKAIISRLWRYYYRTTAKLLEPENVILARYDNGATICESINNY
jgi:hypothetical protein